MQRLTAVASLIAAVGALAACGTQTPDASGARTTHHAPHVVVELQALPDGHPPIPGYDSRPALPEDHPVCPAGGLLVAPPDAEVDTVPQAAPGVIST
jgi:hypothetical protein